MRKSFGLILKKLRQEQGLSQEQLALNCGLDRTFISLLERGERQPSLMTVFALAGELKVPAADIVAMVEKHLPARPAKSKKPRG